MVLGFTSHYYNFLPALLTQLIPNTKVTHPITYTNHSTVMPIAEVSYVDIGLAIGISQYITNTVQDLSIVCVICPLHVHT